MSMDRAVRVVRSVRTWATVAPTEAWQWALQHPSIDDGDEEFSLTETVLRVVARPAPATAVAWVDRALTDGPTAPPDGLLGELCTALLASEHPAMAQDYLRELSRNPTQSLVEAQPLTSVGLYVTAHQSPEAAINWLAQLPSGSARDSALVAIASEWTQHDAPAALAWALNADPSSDSAQAVIGAWARRDSVTAADWLQAHENTPQIDTLIHGFVFHSSVATDAPDAARAWVSLIQDDNLRRRSLAALAPSPDALSLPSGN